MTTAFCRIEWSLPETGSAPSASALAAMILIQFPPGSMTLNPERLSAFFRFRGRVIRGMPETNSLPWIPRMPSAKARYSSPVSGTMTRQLP